MPAVDKNKDKPAATSPAPAQSAKPGTAGPDTASASAAPPKEKVEKTAWGKRNAEGELETKLTWSKGQATPEGYDPKIHKGLDRKDFATLADFFQYRADRMMSAAIEAQKNADDERSGTGKAIKAKQKKFVKLQENLSELLAELKAAGVDISKIAPAVPEAAAQG